MIVERYNKKEIVFTDLYLGDTFIYENDIYIKTNYADTLCDNALVYNEESNEWHKARFSSLEKVIPIETKLVVL